MIQIEKFTTVDFQRFIDWIESEEMMLQFCGTLFTYPVTHEQLAAYVKIENTQAFKITNTQTQLVIGHAEIFCEKPITAKLCRILIADPIARGQGLGKAIIQKLTNYCLETLKVDQIELNVYDWNTAAIRCYENSGFKVNPSKTSTTIYKDSEWTAINMIFEK
ncbi:hypothetical protein FFWV33_08560 [Flavobacterium faecale]|uniref:N-acetyltransferase domain-containing protein n=1 Tax=Flavobacterium faecale TaxID=1355330 RepID=A0A2S1LCV5_9FLAO|nr:GNAT family protein [Flavobacterium faecale]AWG21579.1 hypothetical protein FFWV33_08560 [Flavobacterium faecale]